MILLQLQLIWWLQIIAAVEKSRDELFGYLRRILREQLDRRFVFGLTKVLAWWRYGCMIGRDQIGHKDSQGKNSVLPIGPYHHPTTDSYQDEWWIEVCAHISNSRIWDYMGEQRLLTIFVGCRNHWTSIMSILTCNLKSALLILSPHDDK